MEATIHPKTEFWEQNFVILTNSRIEMKIAINFSQGLSFIGDFREMTFTEWVYCTIGLNLESFLDNASRFLSEDFPMLQAAELNQLLKFFCYNVNRVWTNSLICWAWWQCILSPFCYEKISDTKSPNLKTAIVFCLSNTCDVSAGYF